MKVYSLPTIGFQVRTASFREGKLLPTILTTKNVPFLMGHCTFWAVATARGPNWQTLLGNSTGKMCRFCLVAHFLNPRKMKVKLLESILWLDFWWWLWIHSWHEGLRIVYNCGWLEMIANIIYSSVLRTYFGVYGTPKYEYLGQKVHGDHVDCGFWWRTLWYGWNQLASCDLQLYWLGIHGDPYNGLL